MFSSYSIPGGSTKGFSLVQNAFLQAEGLPFSDVLPEEEIRAAFAAEVRRAAAAFEHVRSIGLANVRLRRADRRHRAGM